MGPDSPLWLVGEAPKVGEVTGLVGALADRTNRYGLGTAAPVAFGRRLWAWSFVAMRRCCARPLVVWATPDENAPDQRDLLAASTYPGWTPDSYSREVLQ
ncbi:hypothetical protein GCM10023153_20550 [Ornithinibacter aureus]|uniref:Uncharacterized protein n=1 Tax=Ornithinibacter aureus TaxID=622664 RepID=A0ABP8JWH4_9MICO